MRALYAAMLGCLFLCGLSGRADAEASRPAPAPPLTAAPSAPVPSSSRITLPTGMIGLNTIPTARMDPVGTWRVGAGYDGFYSHVTAGSQIGDHLYLGLRQTSDTASATSLYPGMDAKLRLFRETKLRPEISIGLQSMFGERRMAGEYLALSKRYYDFDFTMGLGWGRFGTRQSIPNPMLFQAFGPSSRHLDGHSPQRPKDWFSGDAGLFGGVEYMTPIDGLSLMADWSSDGWSAERRAYEEFKAPAPWSIGAAYSPLPYVQTGLAYQGDDTVIARIGITAQLNDWAGRLAPLPPDVPLAAGRPTHYDRPDLCRQVLNIRVSGITASATLDLNDLDPVSFQIGQAARCLANSAGNGPEQIALQLRHSGFDGPTLALNRRDLEQAMIRNQGSPEEIWSNLLFSDSGSSTQLGKFQSRMSRALAIRYDIDQDISLMNEDSGLLTRTSFVPALSLPVGGGRFIGAALRFNLDHNLHMIDGPSGGSARPRAIRSNISDFADRGVHIERAYLSQSLTLAPHLFALGSIGYLEEMYGGASAELLYRPFGKPWAIGLELSEVFKRNPLTRLALDRDGDFQTTGFINGYYEFPGTNATLHASAGRYLGGEYGGGLDLTNRLDNGVRIGGTVTATTRNDHTPAGDDTAYYAGLTLSLPIGTLRALPDGSRLNIDTRPLGRDRGQRLDTPLSLYDATEPFSYRSITRQWSLLSPSTATPP